MTPWGLSLFKKLGETMVSAGDQEQSEKLRLKTVYYDIQKRLQKPTSIQGKKWGDDQVLDCS